jgi:hypothetical protein
MTRNTTFVVLFTLGALLISARYRQYAASPEGEDPGSDTPCAEIGKGTVSIEEKATPLQLVDLSLTGLAEALLGFEVLEILELGPRGKRIAALIDSGPSKRVARCRVADHLHGRVEADGTFFLVLRPDHELIVSGEESGRRHRYLTPLDHDNLIGRWASRTGATRLRRFLGETPVFLLRAVPLHFVDGVRSRAGVRDPHALATDAPSSYSEFVTALRELLAKRLPRITFSYATTGVSRWNARIEPGGRVAFGRTNGPEWTSESWGLEEREYERIRSALAHLPAPGPWGRIGNSRRPGDSFVQVKVRDEDGVVTIDVFSNAVEEEPDPVTRSLGILAEASRLLERDVYGLAPFRVFAEQD